jgi:uncharacterized membrane protein SpoIIM required for sporulation
MVLESLLSTKSIKEKPYKILIHTVIGTIVAIFITIHFVQYSLFLIFLITLSLLPTTIKLLRLEEKQKEYDHFWDYVYKGSFLRRHFNIFIYFLSIIIGITLTVAFFYMVLPKEITYKIFYDQISTIELIIGSFDSHEIFSVILMNNLLVMTVCFLFSLFYSTGALFWISWNASVFGVVVGREVLRICTMFSLPVAAGGIPFTPLVLLSYPHAILEFGGYILAGIAGGIL